MSRSGEFCPRCGDPISESARVVDTPSGADAAGGASEKFPADGTTARHPSGATARDRSLCDACFVAEYDLVDAPDRVEVRVCSRCGAVHRGNRWVDVGADDYTDIAVDEVTEALGVHVDATAVSWEVSPEQVDETTVRMHCRFSGVLRETPVSETVVVPVKIGRETCTRCGRIAGGAYASTVQVRATGRDPTEAECDRATELAHDLVGELEEKGDRDAFVTEVTETEGGVDIRLSTNRLGEQVARRVVEELGGSYSDFETLVTEDSDGNEVYRVTYPVHLPPYREGELIAPEGESDLVLVVSADGTLTGLAIPSGDPYRTPFESGEAPEARRVGHREEAQEATVVAVEDEHAVQILDPDRYEAVTVARPPYFDPDAETVPIVRNRDTLYILPAGDATDSPVDVSDARGPDQ